MKHAMIHRLRWLARDAVVRDMLIKSRPDLPIFIPGSRLDLLNREIRSSGILSLEQSNSEPDFVATFMASLH